MTVGGFAARLVVSTLSMILFLGSGEARAVRYAVPSGGSATGDCTDQGAPCTLEQAAAQCSNAAAHDAVVARAGSYTLAQTLMLRGCDVVRDPADNAEVVVSSTGGGYVIELGPKGAVGFITTLEGIRVKGDVRHNSTDIPRANGLVVEGDLVQDFFATHFHVVGAGLTVGQDWQWNGRLADVFAGAGPVRVGGAMRMDLTDGATLELSSGHVHDLVLNGYGTTFVAGGTFVLDQPLVATGPVTQKGTLRVPAVNVQGGGIYGLVGPLEGSLDAAGGDVVVDAAATRIAAVHGDLDLRARARLRLQNVRSGDPLANPVLPVSGAMRLAGTIDLATDEQNLGPVQRVVALQGGSRTGQVLVPDSGDFASARIGTTIVITRGPELEEPLTLARTNDVITVPRGSWVGKPAPQVARRWQRCDGDACTDVPGESGESYRVTAADAGHSLQAVETAVSDDRSASAASPRIAIPPLPACANGVDDDDDGFVDAADPQCKKGRPMEGPKDDPQLGCTTQAVILTDVLPAGRGRVRFAGLSDPDTVGARVTIRTGRRVVATATVLPGGRFAVVARAKGRRFTASVGPATSRSTRLQRQTVNARVVRRNGLSGLSARVISVRRARAKVELLARTGTCGPYRVVATARLPKSGRFTIFDPTGGRVLRARILLSGGRRTFSLARTVR